MNIQQQEERDFSVSSIAEWDSYEAGLAGEQNPDQAWILSDRDVWYPNRYYTGPAQPHPEDIDYSEYETDCSELVPDYPASEYDNS